MGSGKSSLLSALLGNMRNIFGTVSIFGTVAYAAQIPFIQNSTLKENILFGTAFDEEKYERTLRECALIADIKVCVCVAFYVYFMSFIGYILIFSSRICSRSILFTSFVGVAGWS